MKRWMIWGAAGLVVFLGGPACTGTEKSAETSEQSTGEDEGVLIQPIRIEVGPQSFRYLDKARRPIPAVMLNDDCEVQVNFTGDVQKLTLGPFRLVEYDDTRDGGGWSRRDEVTFDVVDYEGVTVGRDDEGTTVSIENRQSSMAGRFKLRPLGVELAALREQIQTDRHLLLFTVKIDGAAGTITFDPPWDPKGPHG